MASTLNHIAHPHHVSLIPPSHGFQAFYKSLAERVNLLHDSERLNTQSSWFPPPFNVMETQKSYILDGEVPGVGNQASLHVEWLQNQVLVIDGVVTTPPDRDAPKAIEGSPPVETVKAKHGSPEIQSNGSKNRDGKNGEAKDGEIETETPAAPLFPRQLLRERYLGSFQRSFSFPEHVHEAGLKATLKDGVLRVVVPKQMRTESHGMKIDVDVL